MPFKFITCRSYEYEYLHRHNAHVVLVGEEEKENQKKPKKKQTRRKTISQPSGRAGASKTDKEGGEKEGRWGTQKCMTSVNSQ